MFTKAAFMFLKIQ